MSKLKLKIKKYAPLLLLGLLISFVAIIQLIIYINGKYTVAEVINAERILTNRTGVDYKFEVYGYKYNLGRQIGYMRNLPKSGTRFIIKFWPLFPRYNDFHFEENVPECFEYGKVYETLSCPDKNVDSVTTDNSSN